MGCVMCVISSEHACSACHNCFTRYALRGCASQKDQTFEDINMDAIKAEAAELACRRAALEADIAERSARLNAPGQPGMNEPLIDAEVSRSCPTYQ